MTGKVDTPVSMFFRVIEDTSKTDFERQINELIRVGKWEIAPGSYRVVYDNSRCKVVHSICLQRRDPDKWIKELQLSSF